MGQKRSLGTFWNVRAFWIGPEKNAGCLLETPRRKKVCTRALRSANRRLNDVIRRPICGYIRQEDPRRTGISFIQGIAVKPCCPHLRNAKSVLWRPLKPGQALRKANHVDGLWGDVRPIGLCSGVGRRADFDFVSEKCLARNHSGGCTRPIVSPGASPPSV